VCGPADVSEPARRNLEQAYNIRSFYPSGDVPTLPAFPAGIHAEAGEQRLSSTMALNTQSLTDALVELATEHVALLEQSLDQAKRELAQAKEKIAARDEQIQRIRAIIEGL
jgi:hypothetical protein